MRTSALLEVKGLSKVYPNGYEALNDISFSVRGGEFICIIGRSGAGKSTLLRCINGLIPISGGSIRIDGTDISALNENEKLLLRRRIGFIFQEFNLIERVSVLHNVLTGRLGYINDFCAAIGYFNRSHREKALWCLQRVNMVQRARYRADRLSGGEKQRVAIARALAQEPLILLADEPVANLDIELTWGIMEDLRAVAREENVPILVNIHDLETAKQCADRIIGIARGRIVYDGAPTGLTSGILQEIYQSDSAPVRYTTTTSSESLLPATSGVLGG
uniref:Phosphonates import ATP-binding protein PhnC n=1 Tax=Thermosporothrix sp. COM3 TaxID=2490863 RepID=A0A455SUT2_9CHLR|nr:phosphonates import ATP-binding protein PhnC [Thermosporothrix sp. COM3]